MTDDSIADSKPGIYLHPLAQGRGAGVFEHPLPFQFFFCRYLKNSSTDHRRFSLYTCSYIISPHVVKLLDIGRSRSRHPVMSSDLNSGKVWILVIYTKCPITLKHWAIDICTSIYKMYISELRYSWPKVRSILRPLHYKSMGENERRLFWKKTIRNTFKHRVTSRLDTLSRNIATSDPSTCCKAILGHERSPAVFWQ